MLLGHELNRIALLKAIFGQVWLSVIDRVLVTRPFDLFRLVEEGSLGGALGWLPLSIVFKDDIHMLDTIKVASLKTFRGIKVLTSRRAPM